MRQFHYLLLLLASFVFITACSDDDFYVEPVLKVSKTSLTFDNTASQASVNVTKNKNDEFYATLNGDQGAEWLKVVPTDSGFDVVVEENTEKADRNATITLRLKKGTMPTPTTISVKQSQNSEMILSLSEEDLHFNSAVNEAVVRLIGNFTDIYWDVSSDVDWVEFDKSTTGYKFTLRTLDNPGTVEREARVTVKVQGVTASLNVTQDGRITWELPFLEFGYDLEKRKYRYPNNMAEVTEFEEARGSTFESGMWGTTYTWATKSTLIPKLSYNTQIGETTLMDVRTFPPSTTFMTNASYWAYLESEGFKLTYADAKGAPERRIVFWSKERGVAIIHDFEAKMIHYAASRDEPHHHITGQLRPCPTFDKFPVFFSDFSATLAGVDAWEAQQSSKQLERGPVHYTYEPVLTSKNNVIERVYRFKDDGTVNETWLIFEDVEVVFFMDGSIFNQIATSEFRALMEAEGFTLVNEDSYNGIWYTHPTKNVDLYACIRGYVAEDMLPRVVIQITPVGGAGHV